MASDDLNPSSDVNISAVCAGMCAIVSACNSPVTADVCSLEKKQIYDDNTLWGTGQMTVSKAPFISRFSSFSFLHD